MFFVFRDIKGISGYDNIANAPELEGIDDQSLSAEFSKSLGVPIPLHATITIEQRTLK